jgi:hypothetical protein
MKRIISLVITLSITLSVVMPALAATVERDPPGDLAVRIFLGFCALIIVAQLVPLARQALRRLSEKKTKRVEATAEVREN